MAQVFFHTSLTPAGGFCAAVSGVMQLRRTLTKLTLDRKWLYAPLVANSKAITVSILVLFSFFSFYFFFFFLNILFHFFYNHFKLHSFVLSINKDTNCRKLSWYQDFSIKLLLFYRWDIISNHCNMVPSIKCRSILSAKLLIIDRAQFLHG